MINLQEVTVNEDGENSDDNMVLDFNLWPETT